MHTKSGLGILSGLLLIAGSLVWLMFSDGTNPTGNMEDPGVFRQQPVMKEPARTNAGPESFSRPMDKGEVRSAGSVESASQEPFISLISLIGGGSVTDISRLIGLYEELEEGPEKYAAFFALVKYWARTDPDAAIEYALSVKVKERDREKLYTDVYGPVAGRNPGGFVTSILTETNPDLRAIKSAAAIQLLGTTDPELVIPVIESEERVREREDLLKMWLKDVVKSHPDSVLDYIENFTDYGTRQEAAASAIMEVSKTDPELAGLNYAKLLHDTETKVSVLPGIIKGYYRNSDGNTAPVEQWIYGNLTTTEEYDAAAATMVELMVADNVDVALQWLDSIENENLYNATVQEIEKKYAKKSKSADPNP